MMDILLVALNASYSHTNLAIRYLQKTALESKMQAEIIEFTINEQVVRMADELIALHPQVIGLSCYIWNYEMAMKVVERVKLAYPQILVILGGPQMIDCDREWMENHPLVDFVLVGEGETAFNQWCDCYRAKNHNYQQVANLWWRTLQGDIIYNYVNCERGVLGQGYANEENLEHRLVYYEASRGCAYRCTYCLSSLDKRVHYRDLEAVKSDLYQLAYKGTKTVKLVDRTFNLQEERARAIIDHWCSLAVDCCLHGEIVADIVSEEFADYLTTLPTGRLQFEIGVQSVNQRALQEVNRHTDWKRAKQVISKLLAADNIHIHLDLLVGLPYEDLSSFRTSFNEVYQLQPHYLQIGMLKVLPGTKMKEQSERFKYNYSSFPPYELISNPWLAAIEVVKLHHLADVIDRLYNHLNLRKVHTFLAAYFNTPFDYWMELANLAWLQGMLTMGQKNDIWAYLPVELAKQYNQELAEVTEQYIHLALLEKERRYHFGAPFIDSGIADNDFIQYRETLIQQWPHLKDLSLKELKRQVTIHRLPALVKTDHAEGLVAFLYPREGTPCQGYFSWE